MFILHIIIIGNTLQQQLISSIYTHLYCILLFRHLIILLYKIIIYYIQGDRIFFNIFEKKYKNFIFLTFLDDNVLLYFYIARFVYFIYNCFQFFTYLSKYVL